MIDYLLSPLTWLIAGLVACMLLRRRRRLRGAAIAWVVFAAVLTTPSAANLLVRAVEMRAPTADACAADTPPYVVVLAGGLDREPADDADVSALAAVSLRRLFAGIAQFRTVSATHLLIAGGSDFAVPESRLLARVARDLGVPADAIGVEPTSSTTWENAQHVAALDPPPPHRFWLVTSALHLTRAMIAFRAAGFAPCPIASDSVYMAPGGLGYYLPHTSALRKAEWAIHELVGEVAYRVRAARQPVARAAGQPGASSSALISSTKSGSIFSL